MDYRDALEMAGAEVHCYESFGSYQGDWVAKVTYEGKTGWVKGYYGSCSGCDSLQSQFDFRSHTHKDCDYYDPIYEGFKDDCEECQKIKREFIEFGKNYMDLLTQEEIEAKASENLDWDTEASEFLEYVKANKI